jgi:uncharacterized caspase-like protein
VQAIPIRIVLILFVLALIYPSSLLAKEFYTPPKGLTPDSSQRESAEVLPGLIATAGPRVALVIGNSTYTSGPLKNPVNDATDLSANLKKFGFVVTLKKNANHQEMEDAIREFGDQLRKGGVGLFFYAGHGVQIGGRNYLLPVGTRINKDTDVKFQAVDTEIVLAEMGNAGNTLNIVILDACRDNPFGKSFRTASRGLAIISDAPKGTFITYSTSPGKVAADGSGRNSPYTESLIRHMRTPGLQIEDVFKEVRKDMGRKTGGQQVPWELSSLEGQFYFLPGSARESTATVPSGKASVESYESSVEPTAATDALDEERKKVELEKQRLEKEEALLVEKTALEEKRQQLEAKKKQLAMGSRPSVPSVKEIRRDGQFIAYDNGTVLDTSTNLMWAAKDNGNRITWANAKTYSENYRGGGYTDWRMPTRDELAGLYDTKKTSKNQPTGGCGGNYHITDLVHITCCCPWALETNGSDGTYFNFGTGPLYWFPQTKVHTRALPVRSAK